ncbi:MAG TPA: glycosyltransferase family 4 protein, partial [Vicinamibacteria bacterium]
RRLGLPIALQCEVSGEMSGEAYVWGTPFQHGVVRRIVGGLTRLRNRALAKAEAFVAISEETRSEFLAAGLDPSRVHLVPHGVDLQRFRPASPGEKARLRETLGLPTKAALVCFTGRLLRGKGVETLLAAAAALRGDLPRLHVLLVGSGAGQALSVEPHLRARAAEEDLRGAVTFAGRVDNVEDYLRAADLFAFPSLYEAMPLSVLEAAASALPTVATAVGGIRDVLEDGRSGLLVRPGDVTGLREGLASLLRESSRAAEMGRAARASVEAGFDLRRNLERYRDLLRETAAAGAARHRET